MPWVKITEEVDKYPEWCRYKYYATEMLLKGSETNVLLLSNEAADHYFCKDHDGNRNEEATIQ